MGGSLFDIAIFLLATFAGALIAGVTASPLAWVFQPVGVSIFAMSAAWLGAKGALSGDVVQLFLLGLPALALGTWVGFKLYGRLDDAMFRKAVLVLLLISGVTLVI
jgi:hypothetical protein